MNFRQWPGLPYLTFAFGAVVSIYAWYQVIREIEIMNHIHFIKQATFPWTVLIIGICISILIAAVIRVAQLAEFRALVLNHMNENLKREIGDRMNAEDIKQKLEVALLQGQKLQSIGTLAAGIAHDFNNILYAIIGYTELAREDVAKDSLTHANLGKVLDASHRGQELVSRILAFSRRQHQEYEVIHLNSTIEAALALLRPTIPASVIIHFEPTFDMVISGNQTQLHQVLVNIITNAVDAMDGEGTINIRMKKLEPQDAFLRKLPQLTPGHYCKIDITDTGHGMDQATMDRIFEPFFTTKEVGKGTGLGMSIVHTIIKDHGGEITVTSQLGHGTTFTILLPEFQEPQGVK